jgi:hypothetical protein
MTEEEKELLELFEKQDSVILFRKAASYLNDRNALFKEREDLYNRFYKIKDYLKQVHIETQKGILSSNNLIWENIERLCDGKDILGSDKE